TFDTNMVGQLDASDLSLYNATQDRFITGAVLLFSNGGTKASFHFPDSVGDHWPIDDVSFYGILPDGYYRAVLSKDDVPALNADYQHDADFMPGDTDGNWVIDFDDFSRTDGGFNNHLTGYNNGDFDYNNVIDFDDFVVIDAAFNTQVPPPPSGPGTLSVEGR